jgi:hypothetical protein
LTHAFVAPLVVGIHRKVSATTTATTSNATTAVAAVSHLIASGKTDTAAVAAVSLLIASGAAAAAAAAAVATVAAEAAARKAGKVTQQQNGRFTTRHGQLLCARATEGFRLPP